MEEPKVTVLLIDENATEAARIRALLAEGHGRLSTVPAMELLHAPDFSQAKAVCRAPDVTLVSLHQNESNPAAALKRFQADLPAAPVIILNGHSEACHIQAAIQAGVADCLESSQLNARSLSLAVVRALENGRIQQQFAESEKRFLRLLANSPDLIYRYRLVPPRGFEYVSSAATVITGYTPEEHYADPDLGFKLVHPDDRHLLEAAARGELPSGQLVTLRWVQKDGSVIWTEQRNMTLFNDDGQPIAIEGIARDVTRRKQAEEALYKSNARFEVATDHPDLVLAQADRDLRYTWIRNPHPDFDPEQVLGKRDDELADNEGTQQLVQLKQEVIDSQQNISRTITFPLSNGFRSYAVVARPVRDNAGGVTGVATASLDITERKQAENALQQREAILGAVARTAMRLLKAVDWENEIEAILSQLGRAAEASRSYIFQVHTADSGEILASYSHEWCAPGITAQINNDDLQNLSLEKAGYGRWVNILSQGELVQGAVLSLPQSEQELLLAQDIKSIVVIPIFANGHWWGFIGFDQCENERIWSLTEVDALHAAASSIGSTIERVRAEQTLRDSEARYRALFEQSNDAVFILDLAGNHTLANHRAAGMLGYTPEDILHLSFREVTAELVKSEQVLRRILAGETIPTYERLFRKKNGELLPVEINVELVRDDEGNPLHIQSLVRDISERKQVEEALHLRSAALEAAANAIVITDIEGIILWANSEFARLSGYPIESIIGKNTRILKSGKHNQAFHENLWDTILAGKVWRGEITNKRKDGTIYTEQMTITPVQAANQMITHFIAIKEDITERLAQEKRERRSQRLESIGTLANGLAHDLNNALAPVALYLDILRMDNPEGEKPIEIIASGIRRAGEMVRQLVTFARGAEGKRILVQLNHLVKEIQSIIAGTFPKNIQVDIDYQDDLPAVLGDATQLHQVLLNLCVNARDAMPRGGTVLLKTTRQEVDADFAASLPEAHPGSYVRLRVQDTGEGMTPEVMERIFEPFFSTKTPDKGSGLGLATVMGIVRGHGGFIHVESQPGAGTKFDVYLPVAEGAEADNGIVGHNMIRLRGKRELVLVVEDEVAIQEILRIVLENRNYTPVLAGDGAEGLLRLAENRAELRAVITDLHMPQMDGLAFVRALRRLMPEIPVIVTTGHMEEDVRVEFRAMGVTSFLEKPFTEEQLVEAVQQCLVG